uniref:Uncharacterized protein n=1 Tax=Pararge aegeria TaxID=116150 RepID=S4PBG2_9NEOP
MQNYGCFSKLPDFKLVEKRAGNPQKRRINTSYSCATIPQGNKDGPRDDDFVTDIHPWRLSRWMFARAYCSVVPIILRIRVQLKSLTQIDNELTSSL